MKIIKIKQYKDGGTYELIAKEYGVICIDNRLGSDTKGRLYNEYPKLDKTNMIIGFDFMYGEIVDFLKHTEDPALKKYEDGIVELINSKK